MRISIYLLALVLALFLAGNTASSRCLPGTFPGVNFGDLELCGMGVYITIDTVGAGSVALIGCVPLATKVTVSYIGGKVCDFYINMAPGNDPKKLNGVTLYLNTKKGYTDTKGLHCFYTDRWGGSEIEEVFPPYDANVWKNKVPTALKCTLKNKSISGCARP